MPYLLNVQDGHSDHADLHIRSDSETWVRILNEETSPLVALITGKLKLKGNPSHLKKFKSCMFSPSIVSKSFLAKISLGAANSYQLLPS
jgi:hypothetical protein